MALPPRLVDSGFLYELLDRNAPHHQLARQAVREKAAQYFIPDVVLTEAVYLVRKASDYRAVLTFMDALIAFPKAFVPIMNEDVKRVREIMAKYPDAELDFVDCCIMALSERLKITSVCTFDRRDFALFRPNHVDHLELLPATLTTS